MKRIMDPGPGRSRFDRRRRLVPPRRLVRSDSRITVTHAAFTLLEIILALAILAGALAVLGEVMRLADQTASLTENETQAQILAASVMDELACGARELAAVDQQPLVEESDPPWIYSVAVQTTEIAELVAVRVMVEQQLDARLQPAHFELVRWMQNPDYVAPEATDDSSSSSSSAGSSGGSSSSGGSTSATGTGGGQQ